MSNYSFDDLTTDVESTQNRLARLQPQLENTPAWADLQGKAASLNAVLGVKPVDVDIARGALSTFNAAVTAAENTLNATSPQVTAPAPAGGQPSAPQPAPATAPASSGSPATPVPAPTPAQPASADNGQPDWFRNWDQTRLTPLTTQVSDHERRLQALEDQKKSKGLSALGRFLLQKPGRHS